MFGLCLGYVWAMFGPCSSHVLAMFWPYYVWPYLAILGHTWLSLCLAMFGYVWLCLAMLGHAWSCLVMLGHAWPCLAMSSYVWLCLAMFDYVLPRACWMYESMKGVPVNAPSPRTHETRANASLAGLRTTVLPRPSGRVIS